MEHKAGGKCYLNQNMYLRLIENKYHEGNVKRTLERELNIAWTY